MVAWCQGGEALSPSEEAATREPGGPPSEEKLTPTFFIIQSLSRLEGRFDQMDRRLDDLKADMVRLDVKIDSVRKELRSEIGTVVRWSIAVFFTVLAAVVVVILTHA